VNGEKIRDKGRGGRDEGTKAVISEEVLCVVWKSKK
jgi:hypothetical protein